MNDAQPPKAVLSISVDGALNVDVNFGGREELLLGMLGALRYAEGWITDRIRGKQGARQQWSLRAPESTEYTAEKKVSRDDARSAYEYAINALQLRIDAITKCPKEAEFTI